METIRKAIPLTEKIDNFIFNWSNFPIDLWWRKKYNVPFGSPDHRSMSFIDMAIEYQESLLWNKTLRSPEENEMESYIDDLLGEKETVKMSQKEIDEDFENLNLEEFDK